MVDTQDLFRKLGAGAKFDFKRFSHDAEKFKVSFFPTVVNIYKCECPLFLCSSSIVLFYCLCLSQKAIISEYAIKPCFQKLNLPRQGFLKIFRQ